MKRLFEALFPCILLLFALLTAFQRQSGASSALSEAELKNRIMQLSVILRGEKAEGRGCIYGYNKEENALVIITAGHVLADLGDGAEVLFADGTVLSVSALRTEKDCDLGYVYLVSDSLYGQEKTDFDRERQKYRKKETLKIRKSDSLQINEAFYLPDGIRGEGDLKAAGYVVDPARYLEEFGCEMIYADGMAEAGMSGSGMFDEEGRLIGILCGATEHYELAGVPAEKIKI